MSNSFQPIVHAFSKMKSENWAGVTSATGSLIVLFAGDKESAAAVAAFLAAEGIFARFGHKTAGYSAACTLIGGGDAALYFSHATAGNPALQLIMASIAATWLLGGLRYPMEKVSQLFPAGSKAQMSLQATADATQPIVGDLALVQRIPALISAGLGGKLVMFAATVFWASADVLAGRLQDFVYGGPAARLLKIVKPKKYQIEEKPMLSRPALQKTPDQSP